MFNKERLKKIRLIVADLDGTLLNNNGEISSYTKELIKELKNAGVMISFASGRLHSALTGFAEELDIKNPIISLDGSLIKHYPKGEILFESYVPSKYVKKALNYADKFLINIALCHSDAIYYSERNSVIPSLIEKFGAKYQEVPDYDSYLYNTLEISMASDFKENIKHVYDKMSFPYSLGLTTSYFRSHSKKGIYYLEIRKKGSNKGKALKKLLRYLKIPQAETAVMGDWHNDIYLFLPKVLKVTLSNSLPELQRMANIKIPKDNNQDGAAEFLEMVLRSRKK